MTQRQAFVIEDSSQRVDLGIIKLRSGDSDGDNDVDSDDLRLLRRHLGSSSTASALPATNPVYADVNDDGATDILDLAYAAMNLGRSGYFECPAVISGDSGGPQITGVSWEMHPNNSLIFNFGVDMGTLAQVWAEYQRADGKGHTLQTALTEDAATHHDVSVMRLRANTNYCFQVFAKEPDLAMPIPYADASRVSDSVPGSFRTGPLPFGLVDFSATPASGEQTCDLTLLDNNRLFFGGYVAIDKSGTVVWYYQHDALVFAVDQKDNYNLVFGELGEFASISNPQAHV